MSPDLKEFLLSAPAWLIILGVGWMMYRQQNALERKREDNRSKDEAAREANRAADEAARNKQLDRMIDLQVTTTNAISTLRDTLEGTEKLHLSQLDRLEGALKLLQRGWEDNTTALTALSSTLELRFGETIKIGKETHEAAREAAQAAKSNGEALRDILDRIESGQNTILEALNQLLKSGAPAESILALTDEIVSLKALIAVIEKRLEPPDVLQ